MSQAADDCQLIEISASEPVLLAKILRKAWMEGGIKRGLKGTVLVPEQATGEVKILAQGDLFRVESFARWCTKQLGEGATVNIVASDSCPTADLSSKFALADMPRGKASAPWAQLLETSEIEEEAGAGSKLHSSDEGMV